MRRCFLPAILLILSSCLSSCSLFQPKKLENLYFESWGLGKGSARTVAVLPFENETQEPGIPELVRKSFYSHFSIKSFNDVELSIIDQTINDEIILQNKKKFTDIPAAELGRVLKCDAIVYGTVKEMTRFYMGIYSQLAVGAEVAIVDVKTGKALWKGALTTRFHDGDIPLNPFSVVSTTVKTGINIRDAQKLRLVDDLCRNLVALIPDPPNFQKGMTVDTELFYELQVASYRSNENAMQAAESLQNSGYRIIMRNWKSDLGNEWCRLIVGPFASREEAVTCKEKIEQTTVYRPIVLKVERPKGT